jgi:hypothetical protein
LLRGFAFPKKANDSSFEQEESDKGDRAVGRSSRVSLVYLLPFRNRLSFVIEQRIFAALAAFTIGMRLDRKFLD